MEPIRIVIAGVGMRSTFGLRAITSNPEYRLVALVDSQPERMNFMVQEFGLKDVACLTDLRACLATIACDAVAIFSPDGTHADLVVPCLEAGKYVFVEKPLEVTRERLAAIVAADQKAGGKTFVGFNLRYAPVYAAVHDLLQQGVAGKVLTIQADEFYDGGRTYFRRWNRLRSMGGGLWITKSCHDFDLLYWMAGAAPTSVHATSALGHYRPRPEAALHCRDCTVAETCPDRRDPKWGGDLVRRLLELHEQTTGQRHDLCLYNSDKDTFDHGIATVNFANGVMATYTVNVVAGFSNRRMRIAGTKATIDADIDLKEVIVRHRDPSRVERIEIKTESASHGGADGKVFPAFADFVHGRPCRYVAPAEAAVAVHMGLAAQQSCDQKSVVSMSA